MTKKRKKLNELLAQQREDALWAHIWGLGLNSVRGYLKWCESRGYSADIKKSELNFRQELSHHKKQQAEKYLRSSRISRNPMDVVEAVCNKTIDFEQVESIPLREVCQKIVNSGLREKVLPELHRFLKCIWKHTKLPLQHEHSDGQQLHYVDALINVFRLRRRWIRPINEWRPQTHNREKQFLSLVRHLLVAYKVPGFFESVWFRRDAAATRYQRWYVDIGNGESPRGGPAPVTLTKKTAHQFMNAPRCYTIEQAVRFGQIMALGGSRELCAAVIETRLGTNFSNDAFWQSVFRFFIFNVELELSQVGPIVDFLQHHKFAKQKLELEGGRTRWLAPPQPNLSMRKRTLRSLQAQVDEWHERLGKVKADATVRWSASTISSAIYVRGKDEKRLVWRIEELLSQKELIREGRALKHCVVSYTRHCQAGHTSIWSLTREDACGNVRRRQTIEVLGNRQIIQCRGMKNKLPTEQEQNIVRQWAKSEELELRAHGF